MTEGEADEFEGEAEVDALLAEFDGNARAALKVLLHDLEVLARDYSADISRGYVRREKPRLVMRRFGRFSDQHGHHFGDLVLRQVGRTMEDCIPRRSLACRIGGDEFGLIASDVAMDGGQLPGRLRAANEGAPFEDDGGRPVRVTVRVGTAAAASGDTPQTLFARADAALYAAKRGGRNRVSLAA